MCLIYMSYLSDLYFSPPQRDNGSTCFTSTIRKHFGQTSYLIKASYSCMQSLGMLIFLFLAFAVFL